MDGLIAGVQAIGCLGKTSVVCNIAGLGFYLGGIDIAISPVAVGMFVAKIKSKSPIPARVK